jgi:hypothetical protein
MYQIMTASRTNSSDMLLMARLEVCGRGVCFESENAVFDSRSMLSIVSWT